MLAEPAPAGTVLASHHPPISVPPQRAVASLQDATALADVVAGSHVQAIVCGHVHAQITGFLAGRDPLAGEQVHLADITTWQYVQDEEPRRAGA